MASQSALIDVIRIVYNAIHAVQLMCFSENVGRLKKLEYLNLALNNIERIENLEGQLNTWTYMYGIRTRTETWRRCGCC
jgi:Leucine-rich repeat (LRR) protein